MITSAPEKANGKRHAGRGGRAAQFFRLGNFGLLKNSQRKRGQDLKLAPIALANASRLPYSLA
jgi:hypothetical protein